MRDELREVGEVVLGHELVRTTLNGVTKPWVVFAESVMAREHMSLKDRLWDDFI